MTEPLDLPWEWKYSDEAGVGDEGRFSRADGNLVRFRVG